MERNAVVGLSCLGEPLGGSVVKWVDGFVSGKTCRDGGGTPEGKVWFIEANVDNGLEILGSAVRCWGEFKPPDTNTAGGIA